jgi:hypothetical protein
MKLQVRKIREWESKNVSAFVECKEDGDCADYELSCHKIKGEGFCCKLYFPFLSHPTLLQAESPLNAQTTLLPSSNAIPPLIAKTTASLAIKSMAKVIAAALPSMTNAPMGWELCWNARRRKKIARSII